MPHSVLKWFLITTTHILALYIFIRGFFPVKTFLPGNSSINDVAPLLDDEIKTNASQDKMLEPQFSRLVLMCIDAMRADMLLKEDTGMLFTRDLIKQGKAHANIAYAHPPTVTMPRLKALTSGNIPSFLDVVSNLDSGQIQEDNIIFQLHKSGKKMVFFGDETWLKLFPREYFIRSDGTTSFYVMDTVEVDNNVTRHIPEELQREDWDVMILHYLGLDHIGHVGGVRSHLMKPKQQEMDNVVQTIYQWMLHSDARRPSKKPTLFVLFSDHGMNDMGNHGGATEDETSALLLFMSSVFEKEQGSPGTDGRNRVAQTGKVFQIDFVPTLSTLMGLPIPRNNIGKMITKLLKEARFDEKYILRGLQMNAFQMLSVLSEYPQFWIKGEYDSDGGKKPATSDIEHLVTLYKDAISEHRRFLQQGSRAALEKATETYESFLAGASTKLAHHLTHYDSFALYFGLFGLALSSVCYIVTYLHSVRQGYESRGIARMSSLLLLGASAALYYGARQLLCMHCSSTSDITTVCSPSSSLITTALLCCLSVCTTLVITQGYEYITLRWTTRSPSPSHIQFSYEKVILFFGTILHIASLMASSLVEEEHQTWYFLTMTFYAFILIRTYFSSFDNPTNKRWNLLMVFVLMACGRLMRAWNQSGIKWRGTTVDIATFLQTYEKSGLTLNQALFIFTLVALITLVWLMLFRIRHNSLVRGRRFRVLKVILFLLLAASYVLIIIFKLEINKELWVPQLVYCFVVAQFLVSFLWAVSTIVAYRRRHTTGGGGGDGGHKAVAETPEEVEQAIRVTVRMSIQTAQAALFCLLLILHKMHNSFLLLLLFIQSFVIVNYLMPDKVMRDHIVYPYWMGQAAFFAFGNSISIATIDFSGAYTGLSEYNAAIVGTFGVVLVYSGPIIFHFVAALGATYPQEQYVPPSGTNNNNSSSSSSTGEANDNSANRLLFMDRVLKIAYLNSIIRTVCMTVFSVAILMFKHHLFIWSVFSPKYLYEATLTIFVSAVGCLSILAGLLVHHLIQLHFFC